MMTGLSDLLSPAGDLRLAMLAKEFRECVTAPDFPCVYTGIPFTTGEIVFGHHSWVPGSDADAADAIVADLEQLADLSRQTPDQMAVLFVDHGSLPPPTLADEFTLANAVVRRVMELHDDCGLGSDHPLWILRCRGVGLFLNFSSPNHRSRRSRNVGSVLTVIAQARESFDRKGRASERVRTQIRKRVAEYDDVAPHPCLGNYGDLTNREALQFFLGDDSVSHWDVASETGVCSHILMKERD